MESQNSLTKITPGTGGFLNPTAVLEQIGLQRGMKVGDFGSGHGYFSVLVAKMIGAEGQVYAVDILPEALAALRSRAEFEGVKNIKTIHADLELPAATRLADNSLDLVLLANILFQTQKKEAVLREAWRTLKPKGQLVVIDWDPSSPAAPHNTHLLNKKKARALIEKIGFVFEQDFSAGAYHWGMLFKKPLILKAL